MIKNVVFDIGAVLVDWNPRYYYRKVIQDEALIEKFLGEVATFEFNHTLDLGRPWEDARAELMAKFPEYEAMIDAYWHNWLEMFSGPIHESVDILMDIKRRGYPLYALSNWNDVKFQVALQEFPFLRLFDGRIVSGEVKLGKPDPQIYQLLLDTYKLNPRESLFIDDRLDNVNAARQLGIEAIQFLSPVQLERDLIEYGVIPAPDETDDDDSEFSGGCGAGCTCHH
jgi:2-haloacid dehalogenase